MGPALQKGKRRDFNLGEKGRKGTPREKRVWGGKSGKKEKCDELEQLKHLKSGRICKGKNS